MQNRNQQNFETALATMIQNHDIDYDMLRATMKNVQKEASAQLEEIYRLTRTGKSEKALRRIHRFVKKFAPPEHPDWVCPSIHSEVELEVYLILMQERIRGKHLFPAVVPMGIVYHLWGLTLVSLGKVADAQKRFRQSQEWNPFARLNYFYMDRYCEENGDEEGWLQNIRQEYQFAIYPQNLAEVYAELGCYLMHQGKPAEAAAVIAGAGKLTDGTFKPAALDEDFRKALAAQQGTGTDKSFAEICREYGIDEGPDAGVTAAFKEAAAKAEAEERPWTAAALYRQLGRLTGDPALTPRAEAIEKEIPQQD